MTPRDRYERVNLPSGLAPAGDGSRLRVSVRSLTGDEEWMLADRIQGLDSDDAESYPPPDEGRANEELMILTFDDDLIMHAPRSRVYGLLETSRATGLA